MKPILLIIFLMLVICTSFAQIKTVEYYKSGKIKIQCFVKNNIYDSTFVEYYENGQKKSEGTFKKCTYKTSSTMIVQSTCGVGSDTTKPSEGIKNGLWKTYYEDGKLNLTGSYFCNIRVGQWLSYDEKGKLDEDEFYNAGKLIQKKEYYSNGNLESFLTRTLETIKEKKDKRYKNDNSYTTIHTDNVSEYYETGELSCVKTLNNDDELTGKYTEYWPNGFVKVSGEYKEDKKNGTFIEYYENGNTKFEGIIKDDVPQDKQYFLNQQGKVIKIETWKKGVLVSTEMKDGK